MMAKSSLGLALSGGGARGLAHIGVLKVLEREGIPIDLLAGTSMGGLVAAAYAAGMSAADLEQEALRMASLRRLLPLADPTLPRQGLFQGQRVVNYLSLHLGERTFDHLRIPLALVAVDLNSQRQVILRQGRVVDAVRATIAIPGLLTPVKRDGQLLVDGGVLNNLPTDVVRSMGADVVVAVDVPSNGISISRLRQHRYIPNGLIDTLDVLWRSLMIMIAEIERYQLAQAPPDALIRPDIPAGVTALTGFTRADEIIGVGEEAAIEALPHIWDVAQALTR